MVKRENYILIFVKICVNNFAKYSCNIQQDCKEIIQNIYSIIHAVFKCEWWNLWQKEYFIFVLHIGIIEHFEIMYLVKIKNFSN